MSVWHSWLTIGAACLGCWGVCYGTGWVILMAQRWLIRREIRRFYQSDLARRRP